MRIGTNELLIILVVALLIFGPKNLPKLGKMFGKTINGFKKGMDEDANDDDDALTGGVLRPGKGSRVSVSLAVFRPYPPWVLRFCAFVALLIPKSGELILNNI